MLLMTTADRTINLFNASGTILVTGSTGDITGTMIANDTVAEANMDLMTQ